MSDRPCVSVIIPTYNRERFLPACIESVLQQTYSNVECIVVDDGSSDGTRELIEQYRRRDDRVRYLFQKNAGVSAARNTGLSAAQGELISLLDSDDLWHPWKLELQVRALQALPQVGMVWTDMSAIDEQGHLLHERYLRRMYGAYRSLGNRPLFTDSVEIPALAGEANLPFPVKVQYGEIYLRMLHGNLVHTSTILMRRDRADQVGLFQTEFRRGGEDYAFHLKTCRFGPVAYLDAASILYRIGCADQLTHSRNQVPFAQAFLATLQREIDESHRIDEMPCAELAGILSEAHCWLGSSLRAAGRRTEACTQLALALRSRPTNRSAWAQVARVALPNSIQSVLKSMKRSLSRNVRSFRAFGSQAGMSS